MMKIISLVCALFLLSGCRASPAGGTPVILYTPNQGGGALLATETVFYYQEDDRPLWRFALDAALQSSYPAGTRVISAELSGGSAAVVLSAEAAAGINLTLARACIVLTLAGLGIDRVTISPEGDRTPPVTLEASDFVRGSLVLDDTQRGVLLYFPHQATGLAEPETRTLVVRETDTIEWYLSYTVNEWISGPKTQHLLPAAPEGTRLISLTADGPDCIVNLSAEFISNAPDNRETARMILYCLTRSVTAQPDVSSMRLFIEGHAHNDYFGIDTSLPLNAGSFGMADGLRQP